MTRKSIAALAAVFLAALQGCQTEQATNSGDRSSEGKGSVAFRLSPRSIAVLQSDSSTLTYKVYGPGIFDTIVGTVPVDTMAAYIQGIPCGFRYVSVTSRNRDGIVGWYGIDSLEVYPNQNAFAHINLRKPSQTGGLFLDISMDSTSIVDSLSHRGMIDTSWSKEVKFSFSTGYIGYQCGSISWTSAGRGSVNCVRTEYRTFNVDTTWVDTIVNYPYSSWCDLNPITDSAMWPVDSTSKHVPLTCFRPHYVPNPTPRDTIWGDSVVNNPVRDSSYHCIAAPVNDSVKAFCVRAVYRPTQDSNVQTPTTNGTGSKGKKK